MHPEGLEFGLPRRGRVGQLLLGGVLGLMTTIRWMEPSVFFYGEVARRIGTQRSELVGY